MRYVWFKATDLFLLVDMKEQTPIGSILTDKDSSCIIRYGHHPKSEPMQEELIDVPESRYKCFITAVSVIEARLFVPSADCDYRAIIRHAAEVLL